LKGLLLSLQVLDSQVQRSTVRSTLGKQDPGGEWNENKFQKKITSTWGGTRDASKKWSFYVTYNLK